MPLIFRKDSSSDGALIGTTLNSYSLGSAILSPTSFLNLYFLLSPLAFTQKHHSETLDIKWLLGIAFRNQIVQRKTKTSIS